jgi:hypothetical protein
MRSTFLNLNARDFFKGLVMVLVTALVTGLYELLQNGSPFDWPNLKVVLIASVGAGVAYILKNFFTNSQGELFTFEK